MTPDTASDVLNVALQDAPEIGHEYGYGDLAADLVAALHGAGYTIVSSEDLRIVVNNETLPSDEHRAALMRLMRIVMPDG